MLFIFYKPKIKYNSKLTTYLSVTEVATANSIEWDYNERSKKLWQSRP
jgi:hypothetical protein